MLEKILFLLILASCIYWCIATALVYDFFRRQNPPTRRDQSRVERPAVSMLKPVRGVDAGAYNNFASFCQQDYPEYELLFAVGDPNDPVIPVIQRLQKDFPEQNIHFHVLPVTAPNQKAALLHGLSQLARNEILVVSDSDMRVTPDYLNRVTPLLSDDHTGLITCPYHAFEADTLTARLEALHMGVMFLPGVMVARKLLDMRFAMGATILVRKADLGEIGGFEALQEYLADDNELAVRMVGLGKTVELSRYVVHTILGKTTFREQWQREVRWARTNRSNRPLEYPGLVISYTIGIALLLLLINPYSSAWWLLFGGVLAFRLITAWAITRWTGDSEAQHWLFLLPLRDTLSMVVWSVGLVSRRVVWRGQTYQVGSDGRMQPVAASEGRIGRLLRHIYRG